MKTNFSRILILSLLFVSQVIIAQQTVTGVIKDEGNLPLIGVNVIQKGTTNGTQTDFDGSYSIEVEVGQTLAFSYVGYTTQEVVITANTTTIDIVMRPDQEELTAVVVTALGIKKEKKALGYAVTELSSEDLEQRANGDITKILRGKAAGVNVVNASGLSGAGSSVTIRGITSTGNNQPLYVVDGVRFNSTTNSDGFFGTSRSLDIDPNNIETVNVLKGLSAATLYGADGKNGVIVITTKAGRKGGNFKKKTEVSVTASTFFNEIASLPDYTDQRGQGYYDAYYNFFGNWGATFGRPGFGNIDANGQTSNPYALNSPIFQNGFPDRVDERYDYRNYKSQENFFRTGIVKNVSASVNGGAENVGYNLSVGNLHDEGFLPGNALRRDTFSVGGNAKLSNKLNVSSSINITRTNFKTPFLGSIFTGLLNTPRSIDLAGLPSQHPITGEEINFQNDAGASNPYWYLENSQANENTNRYFAQASLSYDLTDWLSASYQYGADVTIEETNNFVNRGSAGGGTGAFNTATLRQSLFTHTLLLNFDKRFEDDKFGVTGNVGLDISRRTNFINATASTGQTVFGAHEHNFFEETTAVSGRNAVNRPGILAQATFDYNNYLFLSASARNDWTSNFIENSKFYPGVGVSFLPTQAFTEIKSDALTYLKVRANYGTSADFNVPNGNGGSIAYPTNQTLVTNSAGFQIPGGDPASVQATSATLANTDLRPALIQEFELGVEAKLWKNRISFDGSYFKRVTSDLIFTRQLDPSTGFTQVPRNVNEFQVSGIELEMNVTALENENFSWDIGGNFTTNDSEVTELEEDRFQVTGIGTVGNYLVKGEPVNVIYGEVIATDENGNLLTNGRSYETAEDIAKIGDPNPDFVVSAFTAVAYKNFSLTANLQYRQGGDIYSSTARSLLGRGLTTDGDNLQNAGFVLPGINTITGEPNTVVISSGDALFNEYNGGPDQFGIFDGTTIRLQELALTYRFSDKVLDKTPFGNVSLSLVGENLYYNAINVPDGLNLDTNSIGTGVNSNGAGIEGGVSPSSRRYGFSIKATF